MKVAGLMIFVCVSCLVLDVYNGIQGYYQYTNTIASYWDIAERSSTIEKKSEYIDKFVEALQRSNLAGKYNAMYLIHPGNSFDYNFEALRSLQNRLHDISKMDVGSFQYQSAIEQITKQEQGEAHDMLSVFEGVWWKENHFWLWEWVGFLQIALTVLLGVLGGVMFNAGLE